MIVDDFVVARAVLTRMVELGGGIEISAVAGTAEDAVDALAHVSVDVILLDLEMPGAGGLSKLPEIIAAARGARVLVVSSLAEDGAAATVSALAQGAADTLLKPGTGRIQGRFADLLMGKIRALGKVEAEPRPTVPTSYVAPLQAMSVEPLSLLAIGASTGGIHALGRFFASFRFPDRCADPGHPASSGALHGCIRAPAEHGRRTSRADRNRRRAASIRRDHDRPGRRAS